MIDDGFGPGLQDCLPGFDLHLLSSKTPPSSVPVEDLPPCSETLPSSGSMQSGQHFKRPPLEPPTDGIASGRWPTPTAADSRSSGRHSTTTGVMHSGTTLTDAVRACFRHHHPRSERRPAISPGFSARLMGLPPGTYGCASSETLWSRWRQRMRSELSRLER